MLRTRIRASAVMIVIAVGTLTMSETWAGGRHGRSSWYGRGYYGSRSHSSYYSYSNPYLNPYSYESQALPYWLKPDYRANQGESYYSAPAARPDRYGAIAYSRTTGTYGYSFNHYSQAEAEQEALNYCDASDRAIVGWMRNAYGALAVGDDPSQYGWGWGATREAARQSALEECRRLTTDCYIKLTVFSGN